MSLANCLLRLAKENGKRWNLGKNNATDYQFYEFYKEFLITDIKIMMALILITKILQKKETKMKAKFHILPKVVLISVNNSKSHIYIKCYSQ